MPGPSYKGPGDSVKMYASGVGRPISAKGAAGPRAISPKGPVVSDARLFQILAVPAADRGRVGA